MRSIRNVRRSPERPSSATTYHSPRSLNTRRGVIVREETSSRDAVQYSMRSRSPAPTAAVMVSIADVSPGVTGRSTTTASSPSAASSFCSPRPSGPPGSAPGSCIAARPAATEREALRRGQPQRPGEEAGHADEDGVVVDEHVDHLVDERRQPAHRRQLQVVRHLGRRQPEAAGDVGQRHLAPLHQPRQHHEQPAEALLGRAPAAPRSPSGVHHRAQPVDDGPAHVRRRQHDGVIEQPEHPRPERRDVGARHLDVDGAVGVPGHDALGPELPHDAAGPGGIDAHDGDGIGTAGAELLRVDGERGAQVVAGGTLERLVVDDGDLALDAVDAVRPQLVVGRDRARRRTRTRCAAAARTDRAGGPCCDSRTSTATRRADASRSAGSPGSSGTVAVTATSPAASPSMLSRPSFHSASRPCVGRTAATATCRARISSGSRCSSVSS